MTVYSKISPLFKFSILYITHQNGLLTVSNLLPLVSVDLPISS